MKIQICGDNILEKLMNMQIYVDYIISIQYFGTRNK